jgi:hypothetical protein
MSSQEGPPPGLPEAGEVLISTATALVNLAAIRLAEKEHKNAPKAKEAIDAARGVLALCPEDAVGPIKDALAQVQMLYVKERQPAGGQPAEPGRPAEPGQPAEPSDPDSAEREKARAKIWTPPGA